MHAAPARRSRSRGLTLLEMLATFTIAAVLFTAAAPPMVRLVQGVHLSAASNSFMASMRLARSEALKRGSRVAMCKSADGQACTAVGGWEQGWLVFHDANGNGQWDDGEKLLLRGEPLGGELLLTGNQSVAKAITFSATAGPRLVSGGLLAGTLTLCRRSASAGPARQIVISSGGRVRLAETEVALCDGA